MSAVDFFGISYWYPETDAPALNQINLALQPGLTVVAGRSGSGKSTLLRLCNGLVPHYHGGRIEGSALVAGLDILATPTRALARHVGFVFQDPENQFVYDQVEREVAFGLENMNLPRAAMAERVDEALEAVGITELRRRRIQSLSGGERQRVALASALALQPEVVVLDEPTSQLDPSGAAAILEACRRLAQAGVCILLAEHRLDEVLAGADSLMVASAGRISGPGAPAVMVNRLDDPPSLVELGRRLGWADPPFTAAGARRQVGEALRAGAAGSRLATGTSGRPGALGEAWSARNLSVGPGASPVLDGVNLSGGAGEAVVLMGNNGSGKTTLLRALAGLLKPHAGEVTSAPGRIAYLPQHPAALLHRPTVRAEVELTLHRTGAHADPERILNDAGLLQLQDRYPRDLSSGEQQRAALAAVIAGNPSLILLDEPTRGMDPPARRAIGAIVARAKDRGAAVVIATHDSDLAAEIADRVVMLDSGDARDLGPPSTALTGDTPYATTIARLFDGAAVTVDDAVNLIRAQHHIDAPLMRR